MRLDCACVLKYDKAYDTGVWRKEGAKKRGHNVLKQDVFHRAAFSACLSLSLVCQVSENEVIQTSKLC